jgi:protoporphyrinogen IX oxidase
MYEWIKALHVIAVISWMAALLYLPRLYVYHAGVDAGSETSDTFKIMERRLLRFIANPAMIVAWGAGLYLLVTGGWMAQGWMHAKLLLVILMSGYHGWCAATMKRFARDANIKNPRYFRFANEIPTLLMVAVVIAVVVKPF